MISKLLRIVRHIIRRRLFPACILFFSVLALHAPSNGYAQGNLLIMPKRVVFEGARRSQELNLVNIGKDTARYVISLIQMRMKEDGSFEKINTPDSGQQFADRYVRLFPRSVTLAPNETQVVKVQLTRANELVNGEYRSHIYFRAVPAEKPLGETRPANDSTISIHLTAVFGISIPVIVRVGETDARVTVNDLSTQLNPDSVQVLKMTFNRSGNRSVYGEIAVDYLGNDGKTTRVGIMKGFSVYTPNLKRKVSLPLDKVPGIDYKTGKLKITYAEQVNGRSVKLSEEELTLHASPLP